MKPKLKLIAIVGATATGKTRLGVRLAAQLGSELISADSRQVYRELDIGTGKDLDEYIVSQAAAQVQVPYHLIDIVAPEENYTLFRYQRDCYALLAEGAQRQPFASGTPLVLVGGSALYIAAVLTDYRIPDVPENPELRAVLMQRELDDLRGELARANPTLHADTDTSTKGRVVRALEIVATIGDGPVPYADPLPVELDYRVFAVRLERAELHRRIDQRLAERLDGGMIEEVRGLLDRGLPAARLRRLGLEYAQVTAYLAGEKDRAQLQRDLAAAIHDFAKRQETWFRGFERKRGIPVTWIAPGDVDGVLDQLGDWARPTPSAARE
jgi:tRNA dimethylallyltransferase